jgi:hypothetical protein
MFRDGFQRLGYQVETKPGISDLLVTWNKYGEDGELADKFCAAGLPNLVAENAYISPDMSGRRYTALARTGHNGSGWTPYEGPERWDRMEMRPSPWQNNGDWILLCAQRGLGAPGMAMPKGFMSEIKEMIETLTGRHVETRAPPSRVQGQRDLWALWPRLHCIVVWTSNMATVGLLNGIPAIYMGPHHIMEGSARHGLELIEEPGWLDREPAFKRMAWAQWTREEIQSGEAMKCLGC